MGEIGINEQDFLYSLTYWQLTAINRGYNARHHHQWEIARWQTWAISRMLGNDKAEDPKAFIKFSWEIERHITTDIPTDDEIKRLQHEMEEYNRTLNVS